MALTAHGSKILNGDFEFGELNNYYGSYEPVDWQRINYVHIASNLNSDPQSGRAEWNIPASGLEPLYGESFVYLSTGDITPDPNYAAISQQITVNQGWTLSGYYFFGTYDYSDWFDYGIIKLLPTEVNPHFDPITLVDIGVEDVGNYSSTEGWQYFEHTFTAEQAGDYELQIEVYDVNDYLLKSYFAIDHLKLELINADLNHDGQVNFNDFSVLSDNWQVDCSDPTIDCSDFDLSDDGYIDANDLSRFSEKWLFDPDQ